jgi:hypothetical protein
VLVARAVAHAENGASVSALRQLHDVQNGTKYQPWWAARARVCWLAGDEDEAWAAARTAAGLSSDPSVRAFLLGGGISGEQNDRDCNLSAARLAELFGITSERLWHRPPCVRLSHRCRRKRRSPSGQKQSLAVGG